MPPPLPDVTRVALQRASIRPAHERGLWTLIRANYQSDRISRIPRVHQPCAVPPTPDTVPSKFPDLSPADSARLPGSIENDPIFGVGAYELLRTATELFLLLNCRVNTRRELHGKDLEEERARNEGFTPANLERTGAAIPGQ